MVVVYFDGFWVYCLFCGYNLGFCLCVMGSGLLLFGSINWFVVLSVSGLRWCVCLSEVAGGLRLVSADW